MFERSEFFDFPDKKRNAVEPQASVSGALFFGSFLLGKQKKGTPRGSVPNHHLTPICWILDSRLRGNGERFVVFRKLKPTYKPEQLIVQVATDIYTCTINSTKVLR